MKDILRNIKTITYSSNNMAKAKSQKAGKKTQKQAPSQAPHHHKKSRHGLKVGVLLFSFLIVLTIGTLMYQQTTGDNGSTRSQLRTSVINFTDLSDAEKNEAEFQYALKYLLSKGIIRGYDDGTFKSANPVNRAEFIKMLATSEKSAVTEFDQTCAKDVVKGAWFTPYMCYAKDAGWINGYADGTLKPGNTITLAEILKILITAKQWNIKEGDQGKLAKNLDANAWYAPFIKLALVKNLWPADDLDPGKQLNRKQVIILLFKAILVDETKVGSFDTKYVSDLFSAAGIAMTNEATAVSVEAKGKTSQKPPPPFK